jgi:hypothetical protein
VHVLISGEAVATHLVPTEAVPADETPVVPFDGSGTSDDPSGASTREHFMTHGAGELLAGDVLLDDPPHGAPPSLLSSVELSTPCLVLSCRADAYRQLLSDHAKLGTLQSLEGARHAALDLSGGGFSMPGALGHDGQMLLSVEVLDLT